MALNSLMVHSAGNQTSHSSGVTPFDGNAAHFYQWEFKTLMKAQQLQDPAAEDATAGTKERNAKVVDGIISGLTHDALTTAMDIGVERLNAVGGITHLVEQMKTMVFPTKKLEAKELYAQGHNRGGVLARQHNESMLQYINR